MSKIVLSASSRVGCVRSNNEDMILANDRFVRSDIYQTDFMTENSDRFVVAVADGMGGHNAGEVASELALTNLRYYVYDLPQGLNPAEFEEALLVWMDSVNNIINARGKANAEQANMGTTLVGIIFYQGRYFWMNCGDSRLYRLRDGHLVQLTTDHSLNTISGQKKHSNVITNCIGAGCTHAYLDLMEFTDDVREDDIYLLCSDGLNDMVSDSTIEKLLNEKANANTLCEEAINEGGFDNVSACILSSQ